MAKNRSLARKAADGAISLTKQELIERGQRAGRQIVLVPPKDTTQTCSRCKSKPKIAIGLKTRTYECGVCGMVLDRDLNAARNILAAGFNGACVESRRPAKATADTGSLSMEVA